MAEKVVALAPPALNGGAAVAPIAVVVVVAAVPLQQLKVGAGSGRRRRLDDLGTHLRARHVPRDTLLQRKCAQKLQRLPPRWVKRRGWLC